LISPDCRRSSSVKRFAWLEANLLTGGLSFITIAPQFAAYLSKSADAR
jgi:hypothetical protein